MTADDFDRALIEPAAPDAELPERRLGHVEIRPAELQVFVDGRRVRFTVRDRRRRERRATTEVGRRRRRPCRSPPER